MSKSTRKPQPDKQDRAVDHDALDERHRERERGFLTGKHRSFLLDDEEDSATRYRIRNRLKNGIKDFELVNRKMASVDVRKAVFELFDENANAYDDFFVSLGVAIYEALDDTTVEMEEFVEEVIARAQNEKYGVECDVSVDIDIEKHGEQQVKHKLADD